MAVKTVPGIRRMEIPFNGGLNEVVAVTEVPLEDFMELDNWRLSEDGTRLVKKGGTEATVADASIVTDIFGLATYTDSDSAFCYLKVNEDVIRRKVSSGAWATIHSWSSNISHPVNVIQVQGKNYVITEDESRFVHTDKADYQIGIEAPTTLPTIVGGYDDAILEEPCDALGSWADNDAGAGASTQVTYDSKETFRFLNTGSAGDSANRSLYPITDRMPNKFVFETSIYQNTLGSMTATSAEDSFFIVVSTGHGRIGLGFDKKELWVINGSSWPTDLLRTGIINKLDQWVDIKFVYDGSDPDARFCEIYMDDEHQGKWYITDTSASLEGHVGLILYGVNVATDVYVDYVNISDAESATMNGKYRYAVKYARSGNFGNESNPIKSLVGTATLTGTGIDDLSAGGTYTGSKDRTFRVEIDGTGTPDTVKVSYDGGNIWNTTALAIPALSPTELVTNGDFELSTNNWTAGNSATLLGATPGGSPDAYLIVTENGADEPYAYQTITVEPSTHYNLSFYEKNGTETEYRVWIWDVTNGAGITSTTWLSGDAAWTQGHVAFYTPNNCKSIWVILQSRSQNGEGKSFNFDTVTLYEAYVMHLNYGVTLGWGYSTGHTLADYWDIACDALAIRATNQKVTFASIPVSTDAQVDQRKIYRTSYDGTIYYWLATIYDNTTTAFVDNIPDSGLGLTMTENHDTCPNGQFSEWWDGRMWVVDVSEDIVYYSNDRNGESYDEANQYVLIDKGDNSEIRGIKAYKDALYVFTNEAIYVIYRRIMGYGRFLVTNGVGCIAGHSIVEANNTLMFMSNRGVELFNGEEIYSLNFSVPVKRTFDKITRASLKYITGVHHRAFGEVWWSIPDNSDAANYIIVYNYTKNKWARFNQSKAISYMRVVEDSSKDLQLGLCTRDGIVGWAESTAEDFGTDITATARKGWIDLGMYCDLHKIELEYESPTSKDLTLNCYVNFDKDVARTTTFSGDSPSATDIEMRRPIKGYAELGLRCRYFSFELVNSDDTAGDCKIKQAVLWYRSKKLAAEIKGD